MYLFLIAYPGNLTPDSFSQLSQIKSGTYSNRHSYYHTLIIRISISIGQALWGNINAGVALYSIIQIVIMAAIFSFAIFTLFEMGINKYIIISIFLIYSLMPYNWMYSCTMWKDILFGGFCLLFILALYRYRQKLGNTTINLILFFISSLSISLFRSNGFFVFLVTFPFLLIRFIKKDKKIISISIVSIIIALILKGPVLNLLNVTPVDTVEMLSIPLQQIARTIYDDEEFSSEQYTYINSIMEINKVPAKYKSYISDPIKKIARESNANTIINSNKRKFLKYWFSIGIDHPQEYLIGWVDMTKGYWNSGYHYWVATNKIVDNDLGIIRTTLFPSISAKIDNLMNRISFDGYFLSILSATGFYVWIYLTFFFFYLIYTRKICLELVPTLAIIISLVIATPVFNEFRYVYGIYTMMPIAYIIALQKK